MTIEQSWEESDATQDQAAGEWGQAFPYPIPVKMEQTQQVAPEAVAMTSFAVAVAPNVGGTGSPQPTQLCPHAYHRYKAKFLWTVPATTTIYLSRNPNHLMGGALGNAYQIVVGATAITTSQQLIQDYEGQQPLYAVASQAGVQVSVMDETYKAVQ